jgi:acetoin utilization protein AcuB
MNVNQIMSKQPVTVELDDKLSAVKEIFDHAHFHHLLVVEHGKLLGVISDRDLFKAISPNIDTGRTTAQDLATLNKRVHQIVTRKPITLLETASVAEAVTTFNDNRISCIPIVNHDNVPVGILSWRDIFKLIVKKIPPQN